tara:strand:- start:1128 stop:1724 length:597 start_codon:yes stop_codon:yes gene_type:complete
MFTGIVKQLGEIVSIKPLDNGIEVVIGVDTQLLNCELGDSIAVDGVCSTVVDFDLTCFTVQYLPETLDKTTFKQLTVGQKVNLEPSLTLQTKLSGHFVTGHIDGVGTIIDIQQSEPWGKLVIEFDKSLAKYFVYKGSVCLDGISLTVAEVTDLQIVCYIIPHTFQHTNLQYKKIADQINIECDMLGKYILRSVEIKNN